MGKGKSKKKINYNARIVLTLLLVGALLVSLFFCNDINRLLGLTSTKENEYDGNTTDEVIAIGDDDMNIHFVDVGQGDACIIELPDERNLLIDAGSDSDKEKLLAYIDNNIKVGESKLTYFDIAILTHADEDHCGGMDDVLAKYPAKTTYRPNEIASYEGFTDPVTKLGDSVTATYKLREGYGKQSTKAYSEAVKYMYKASSFTPKVIVTNALDKSQNVIKPENIAEGADGYYELNFYSPTRNKYDDRNDYSPIMILEYEGKKIALSGDAEKEAEKIFVSESKTLYKDTFNESYTVDVIKLGHHGSRTSSSEDYLNTLTTTASTADVITIISCGEDNKYHHPHSEVLTRLKSLGFSDKNILRTDINSNVVMSVKENASGVFDLLYGANVVRVTTQSPMRWEQIVPLLIAVIIFCLWIIPLFGKRRALSYAKKYSDKDKR